MRILFAKKQGSRLLQNLFVATLLTDVRSSYLLVRFNAGARRRADVSLDREKERHSRPEKSEVLSNECTIVEDVEKIDEYQG